MFAGLAIYNALVNHNGNVTARVDGLAASIASVIAMSGDKIIMSPGSMIMIHRPSVYAAGTVDDMGESQRRSDENRGGHHLSTPSERAER